MSPQRNAALLSMLLLASCATVAPGSKLRPPVELLQDCPEPPATVETNSALAQWAINLRDALRGCNRDKAALREWAQ